ncbi:hypothetical protein Tco_1132175 [Tanacetum coccineum]|uniref:Xylulose kinase-1 n=1 Tax=Tanacetum coccineum TaxID=301880 RepID=A0ABQ5JFA2_9ASTR
MTTLKFADTHNMVAFLSKPAECEGFEQIVDFLNAHPIKYALTVNPTIYTSCIEKFWAIVKVKTVNDEVQLQALVDRRKIIINESTVRRVLQLEDAEGVESLPNATIFEQLMLMGIGKGFSGRVTPLFPTMVVQSQSKMGEDIVADEAVYKELDDRLVRAATTASSLEAKQWCQETMGDTISQTRSKNVSKLSSDPLLARGNTLRSDEDRLKLEELTEICTNLQRRVLALEETKTTQAAEIISLKKRVKKLEKGKKSRTHKLKRLYKVGITARVDSSDNEESLGEDASKQGRKINDIDADIDVTLVNDVVNDEEMFDVDVLNDEEINEPSTTTTISSKQYQDKGKGIMVEPEKPLKKKDQISFDEEVALRLQAEFDKEERLARESAEKEQEANIVLTEEWDDI